MVEVAVVLKVTVPEEWVNVPPLLDQSPDTLILEAVPAVKLVPEPNVSVLRFNVVVEPPMVRALVLAVVILLNVWLAALPLMFWLPALLNVTVPDPGVNVPPLLVQSPDTLILEAVPAVKLVPEPNVRVLRFNVVVEPPMVRALVLAVVILLNVWLAALPLMFWLPALLNVTVPDPGVNVPPLLVQSPDT